MKIPSEVPHPGHRLRPHQPAQNVLFYCSIGHYSYDKIADHNGGDARVVHDQGRSLTAIDVSARSDPERRLGAPESQDGPRGWRLHISQFWASNEPPRRTIYLYLALFGSGEAAKAWPCNERRVRCVTARKAAE